MNVDRAFAVLLILCGCALCIVVAGALREHDLLTAFYAAAFIPPCVYLAKEALHLP